MAAKGPLSLMTLCALMLVGCSGNGGEERVAVLFVGHGEPATFADGDVPITLADGTVFGPFAASLGVPAAAQSTEWAAAYDEIATAMTYIFPDLNGNGLPHEMMISPQGDVPPFFTWEAFQETAREHYLAFGDYSPHNDTIAEHVAGLEVSVDGATVDTYLAYLDAVPRIQDVTWDIAGAEDPYIALVVVPMLLSSSTHTQEIEELTQEAASALMGDVPVAMAEPFFEVPYMRERVKGAVVAMAEEVHRAIPAGVVDADIGVVLAAHGTPYVPPDPEYGWQEGEIYSYLSITESEFHDEIAAELPWTAHTGRMNYASPTIDEALAAFEADGVAHVMVIPSAFPTSAMHTMWDVAEPSVGRAVTPEEGVVSHVRPSGMTVWYTAQGYADLDTGRTEFRAGLGRIAETAIAEVLADHSS